MSDNQFSGCDNAKLWAATDAAVDQLTERGFDAQAVLERLPEMMLMLSDLAEYGSDAPAFRTIRIHLSACRSAAAQEQEVDRHD